ncbi:Hypothetical protein GLP15_4598 [Giardia lamblia P15]|uniref:Uncharacterized protein n=1 Tax=Giardia intestinalis (strain P15) TaxID=658858 RepID=E1F7Q2_GIAIA|nr:Hypothetical protein GLP15_4598 [Giardia lamblia P15]
MSFGVLLPGKPPITEFEVHGDSQLTLCIPEITSVTHVTVFAIQPPPLPDGYTFGIYLQQGHNPWVCIGAIHAGCHSISVAISKYMVDKQINYTGYIHITIATTEDCIRALEEARSKYDAKDQGRQLLDQIGEALANDLVKYLVSYEGIDYNGDQYIPSGVLDKWTETYHQRVSTSSRFWRPLDSSCLCVSHQTSPRPHQ